MSKTAEIPVYKVGGVILRGLETPIPEVLIVQPKPKKEGIPPMGLPRGTRRYWCMEGTTKVWRDARDAEAALQHADYLEPLIATLQSEMHEEVGLAPDILCTQPVYDLGAHVFASMSKEPYFVQWYAVMPDTDAQHKMGTVMPQDSEFTEWVPLDELRRRARLNRGEAGHINPGYVPVVEMAIARLQQNNLLRVMITF